MKKSSRKGRLGTRAVTMCAIFGALSVVLLYVGSVFEVLDLTSAGIASMIVTLAVIEGGGGIPWMIYAVTSVISALILPNKYPALLYIFFAGIYPIVKCAAERLPKLASFVIKLAFFNGVLTAIIFLATKLLGIPETDFDLGVWLYPLMNLMFLLYDYMLTQLITFYLRRLRRLFHTSGIFGR